ncbi:MAG TPA: hemerythrin domain-containing protein [Noviherbaspirillum sp.]|uniref:hemerythrin domain-containing protein n=1 Tax=Noviherbaspirillum sp. TaxID=1926288 RepID=UPI002D321A31|nr:hemerythrin domain-containing protein [Noviherbaspirillum sp.]HYD93877.1 hemerythrin domain-containing protein [Noviherbaspirillum sp.]
MNIDKFKHQHTKIYDCINILRTYSVAGIAEHAREIAENVVAMSSLIKLHLTVEDSVLYPALRSSSKHTLAKMGAQYQEDMKVIARSYEEFARKWNTAANVAQNPAGFRADANTVLKKLHARIQQEDKHFYPAIEAM